MRIICFEILILLVFATASIAKLWDSINPPISSDCSIKVNTSLTKCKQDYLSKWMPNQTLVNMPNTKGICCYSWETADCYQQAIKGKCSQDDWTSAHNKLMKNLDKVVESRNCGNYTYYSNSCSLSHDFNLDEQDVPSAKCLDAINKTSSFCADKVAKRQGLDKSDLKSDKVICCTLWSLTDCIETVAKDVMDCTRNDLVAFLQFNKESRSNKSKNECATYWQRSDQCNSSKPTQMNYLSILIMIFMFNLSHQITRI